MTSIRPPLLRAVITAVLVSPVVWAAAASAQIPGLPLDDTTTTTAPPPSSSSSTTTTAPAVGATTTTTAPDEQTGTTTTTAPPVGDPSQPGETPFEGDPGDGAVPPPSGDGAPPLDEVLQPGGPLQVPEWASEQIQSVPRSPANNTRRVLDVLRPLEAFGFTPEEIALLGLGSFPVRGYATFVDDWWFPRWTPSFHLHQGTDIFADFGTPITAPADGVLTMGEGTSGGLYTYLTLPDGTYYYFAHLMELPELPEELRITDPAQVQQYTTRPHDRPVAYQVAAGTVIGSVGDSGNAKGGAPHLHFEVHPGGGEPVNPKPILDQWLADAEANAAQVVALHTSSGPMAVMATQRTRAGGPGPFSAPSSPLAPELLGVSSLGPGAGVHVATEEVAWAVRRIEWKAEEEHEHLHSPLAQVMRVLENALGVRHAAG